MGRLLLAMDMDMLQLPMADMLLSATDMTLLNMDMDRHPRDLSLEDDIRDRHPAYEKKIAQLALNTKHLTPIHVNVCTKLGHFFCKGDNNLRGKKTRFSLLTVSFMILILTHWYKGNFSVCFFLFIKMKFFLGSKYYRPQPSVE